MCLTGFEPAPKDFGDLCSIQLSYKHTKIIIHKFKLLMKLGCFLKYQKKHYLKFYIDYLQLFLSFDNKLNYQNFLQKNQQMKIHHKKCYKQVFRRKNNDFFYGYFLEFPLLKLILFYMFYWLTSF